MSAPRTPGSAGGLDAAAHCVTCGDEGIIVRVLDVDEATALCAAGDATTQTVAIELVSPVRAGDELLVHAGVAIRHLGAPG